MCRRTAGSRRTLGGYAVSRREVRRLHHDSAGAADVSRRERCPIGLVEHPPRPVRGEQLGLLAGVVDVGVRARRASSVPKRPAAGTAATPIAAAVALVPPDGPGGRKGRDVPLSRAALEDAAVEAEVQETGLRVGVLEHREAQPGVTGEDGLLRGPACRPGCSSRIRTDCSARRTRKGRSRCCECPAGSDQNSVAKLPGLGVADRIQDGGAGAGVEVEEGAARSRYSGRGFGAIGPNRRSRPPRCPRSHRRGCPSCPAALK